MHQCSQCKKPLTRFELLFHQKANSNDNVASKCWDCSGAQRAFAGIKLKSKKLSHYFKSCFIGLSTILIGFVIFMILLSFSTADYDFYYEISIVVFGVSILGSGLVSTLTILYSRKEDDFTDPEEEQYSYSTHSNGYVGTFSDDGKTLSIKEDTYTSSTNHWSKSKTGCFTVPLKILAAYFMIPTFFIWGIPYLLALIIIKFHSKSRPPKIPVNIWNAYKEAYTEGKDAPITFDH